MIIQFPTNQPTVMKRTITLIKEIGEEIVIMTKDKRLSDADVREVTAKIGQMMAERMDDALAKILEREGQ